MAANHTSRLVRHAYQDFSHDDPGLTDGQLLGAFVDRRDEAAFAALVRRHGPMVWGVCRRLLGHPEAEDAYQATFLVLVRRAGSVVPREMVGSWLHGVARRTALHARRIGSRRRVREQLVPELPDPAVGPPSPGDDLRSVLDEELGRLPDRYRAVLVLCTLEGRTRREAARQLGVPEGTVAGHLARARSMLARRLACRGLGATGVAIAGLLAEAVAPACVPVPVLCSAIHVASRTAAGPAGMISFEAAALAKGVVQAMVLTKLKTVTVGVLLALGLGAAGTGLMAHNTATAQPPRPSAPGDERGSERPGAVAPTAPDERLPLRPGHTLALAAPVPPGPSSPKDLVLAAWERTQADLKSGAGEGVYEFGGFGGPDDPDGRPVRYAVAVQFSGRKYHLTLTYLDGGRPDDLPSEIVVIYDGATLAYRKKDARVPEPFGEVAQLYPCKDEDRLDCLIRSCLPIRFEFDPTSPVMGAIHLPALVKHRPDMKFVAGKGGVSASVDLVREPLPIRWTLEFPVGSGYRVAAFAWVTCAEAVYRQGNRQLLELRQDVAMKWAQAGGVWYAREVETALSRPDKPRAYQRLTYTRFTPNADVDPARFCLPTLGLAPNAWLVHVVDDTKTVYRNQPPAGPGPKNEPLLDGLRRLPLLSPRQGGEEAPPPRPAPPR